LIQDALSRIMKNRTTIIIAHRLSTIKHADKIIVLSHGQIVESGSHKELLKLKGVYYNLYKYQYQLHI
jgi:ABC-type multidrug transport system fused ATPase/permease subunit